MTDTKISALTALGAAPATDDELAIVDTDAGATKRITVANLMSGGSGGYAVEAVTVTGNFTAARQQIISLDSPSAIALTLLSAPTPGDVIWVWRLGSGAVTHTVVLSGSVTWDGTNQTANFTSDGSYLGAIALTATRWLAWSDAAPGGATFSA